MVYLAAILGYILVTVQYPRYLARRGVALEETMRTRSPSRSFAPWELEALMREHGPDLVREILHEEQNKPDGKLAQGQIVGISAKGYVVQNPDGSTTIL